MIYKVAFLRNSFLGGLSIASVGVVGTLIQCHWTTHIVKQWNDTVQRVSAHDESALDMSHISAAKLEAFCRTQEVGDAVIVREHKPVTETTSKLSPQTTVLSRVTQREQSDHHSTLPSGKALEG